MKENLRVVFVSLGPMLFFGAIVYAFMGFAPCGCMASCSPLNTPNRCIGHAR